MSTPKKNRPLQNAVRSAYVCPKTREPLYEHANSLVRDDGLRYGFIRGWHNTPIPDFLNGYGLGDSGEKSRPRHKQTASIEAYRNFLDWLFQTFNENKTDFRRARIRQLGLKRGVKVLVTGSGTGDDIRP